MKSHKHQLIIPLVILFFVVSFTGYAMIQQSVLTEHSPDIIKWLVGMIGVMGSALNGLIVWIFSQLSKKVDKVADKLDNINDHGCAAYNNIKIHMPRHLRKGEST